MTDVRIIEVLLYCIHFNLASTRGNGGIATLLGEVKAYGICFLPQLDVVFYLELSQSSEESGECFHWFCLSFSDVLDTYS